LIPECVGRGVKLGSESWCGGDIGARGGAWKYDNLDYKQSPQIKIFRMNMCPVQNVDKVLISKEKTA